MRKGNGISKLLEVLKIVFSMEPAERVSLLAHQAALARAYKVHIGAEQADRRNNQKQADPWTRSAKSDKLGQVPATVRWHHG